MSVVDANRATEAFRDAIQEAQDIARSGQVGADFDHLLRHAQQLLDILNGKLAELDPYKYADLLAAASILHQKLERLRDDRRGRSVNREAVNPPIR